MVMGELFQLFLRESPLCVMKRAILENILAPDKLDDIFRSTAVRQYKRELLFSQLVDLTSLVVCRVRRQPAKIAVGITSRFAILNQVG
jgi:hypothetical protein